MVGEQDKRTILEESKYQGELDMMGNIGSLARYLNSNLGLSAVLLVSLVKIK